MYATLATVIIGALLLEKYYPEMFEARRRINDKAKMREYRNRFGIED